jgi:hypothetical protein
VWIVVPGKAEVADVDTTVLKLAFCDLEQIGSELFRRKRKDRIDVWD